MIGMTSYNILKVWNTFKNNVWVIRCVQKSCEYCKSSKMLKCALRAVTCLSVAITAPQFHVYALTLNDEVISEIKSAKISYAHFDLHLSKIILSIPI
jgi:hypothetical protein